MWQEYKLLGKAIQQRDVELEKKHDANKTLMNTIEKTILIVEDHKPPMKSYSKYIGKFHNYELEEVRQLRLFGEDTEEILDFFESHVMSMLEEIEKSLRTF